MRLFRRANRLTGAAAPDFHQLGRRRRVVRSAVEPLETRLLFAVGPDITTVTAAPIAVTYNTSTEQLTISDPFNEPMNLTVSSPASNTLKLVLGSAGSDPSVLPSWESPTYPASTPPSGSLTFSTTSNSDDTLTILTDSGHAPVSLFDLGLGNTTDTLDFSLAGTSTGVGSVDITAGSASDHTALGSINITGTLSDTGGAIAVNTSSTITTNGGDIDLTGTGNLPDPVGVGVVNSTLNAGGGNINLIGTGGDSGNGIGVDLQTGSSIVTGSGTITITGTGYGLGEGGNIGVDGDGSSTITGSGAVTISGTGGTAGEGTDPGITIAGTISGSGTVTITGTGGGGNGSDGVDLGTVTSTSAGVTISGSSIGGSGVHITGTVSGSGAVSITGTGSDPESGGDVGVSAASVTSSGAGVTISGSGSSTGEGSDGGVNISGTVSGSGAVTITGTGGAGGGSDGVSGSGAISAGGVITITGTGGSGGGSPGVSLTSVTSTGAGVTITGTTIGIDSSGEDPGVTVSGTVSGSGAVTITGTGATSEGDSDGVDLATVTSTSAGVTITGSGGEGSGVAITGTVSGSGTVSITGTGSGPDDGGEHGVSLTSVISTSAGVTISGSGGSSGEGSDPGVTITGTVSGSGTVTITGTGGGGEGGNAGISVSGAISTGGVVTITGTGGAGSGGPGVTLSNVTSTGAGVTITGSGTGLGGGDPGVSVSGTISGSGAVSITGTAGSEGGGGADGVDVFNVTSTSAGVTITGVSGTGNGVDITGSVSGSGAVTITGTGGGAETGEAGVQINQGSVTATSGGAVTITGSWASATSGDNGVELNGATITSGIPAASPVITGTASSAGQNGVYIGSYGATMNLTLVSAPAPGSTLTIVHDVGGTISGTFSNISNGAVLSKSFNGTTYKLTANYAGGASSQDFVLTVAAPPSGSLAGSSGAAASSYNLTQLGTIDWAHWGTSQNARAFDDKATGGGQISNVTRVGAGSYGAYTDSSRDVIWSDGTPLAKDNGDQSYIWANNATGAGYSFTVPADTTTRTLYVDLGGYDSGGTLTATLSDSSATPYTTSFSGSAIYNDIVAITYKAGSASQNLLITYTKTAGIGVSGGSVDLDAAWIGQPLTNLSPTIVTNPKSQTVTAGTDVTFTASASTIATNPPTVQWYMSTNGGTSFTLIPSQTATTLDIGPATLPESGNEYEAIFTTSAGTANTSAATLTVNPAPSGSLVGSSITAAPSYNYTQLGTTDWIHWGRASNVNNVDRKATGGSQISNVTRLGSGSYGAYADPSRDSIWTDGTPTAKDTGDTAYIWANNAAGAGYSFTAPADTTSRTLYIYLGGYDSGGTLTATLSDSSATPYTVSFSGASHYTQLVAITYKAGSAGQKLTLNYTKSANVGVLSGSVDLIGAWLA